MDSTLKTNLTLNKWPFEDGNGYYIEDPKGNYMGNVFLKTDGEEPEWWINPRGHAMRVTDVEDLLGRIKALTLKT